MSIRSFDQWVVPGLGAAFGGIATGFIDPDPIVVAAAASVGAVAAAMLFVREREPAPKAAPASRMVDLVEAQDGDGMLLAPGQGRALLDCVPMGVVLVDESGSIAYANERAAEAFGMQRLIGEGAASLRHPALIEAIEEAQAGQAARFIDFKISRIQDVHLRAHLRPVNDLNTPEQRRSSGVLIVFEDVTRLFRTVDMHRDFVANASHELKTPLSSITGIIQTLLGHAKGDPEASERFLNMMASQAERMKRLVEDLLSLNRIELNERVQPREVQPLRRIVWEVAEGLIPFAEEHRITLDVAPAKDHPRILGDREELAQVFRNLIENAIKYGRAGTEVTVAVEPDDDDRADQIGISITDRGHGIAREHLPRLTERFYRVSVSRSREKGGTGLGLAIVKHVLNRHRGELIIESVEGEGSKFTVWLPLCREAAADADGDATSRADAA